MKQKTPKQIVALLDQYIIGQDEAKKSVAIALYNRYRRAQLPKDVQKDITPKNILMAGPTGVGKTEIARRLADIVEAPFVKVEATKFTEVGYVGRDVESMVRDLVTEAVRMVEKEEFARVEAQAAREANKILVRKLVPGIKRDDRQNQMQQMQSMMQNLLAGNPLASPEEDDGEVTDEIRNERLSVAEQLDKGLLENREVTIEVEQAPKVNPMGDMMGQMGMDMSSVLGDMMPKKKVKRTLPVSEARQLLIQENERKLVDYDKIYQKAIERTSQDGIIFIDEIDKIVAGNKNNSGEVSREGVQGRFPIRVELNGLSKEDFVKILKDPQNSLLKQYIALLKADGVSLVFTAEAVDKIAQIAYEVNQGTDNIGARRLATILEKLLEDVLYEGPDMEMGQITVTQAYVEQKLSDIVKNKDLTKFIL